MNSLKGLEGYLLYRALVVVFDKGHFKSLLIHIVGYGVPIVVSVGTVIIAAIIDGTSTYHKKDLCWLDANYLYISFFVPLMMMLFLNAAIFIIGLRINYKVIRSKLFNKYFLCSIKLITIPRIFPVGIED